MERKSVQCREHGGTFYIPVKRGRPPTRCSEANPCDMVKPNPVRVASKSVQASNAGARKARAGITGKLPRSAARRQSEVAREDLTQKSSTPREEPAKKATRTRPEAGPVTVRHNPSVVMAKRARDQLEPQGWNLKGRAWVDEDEAAWAEVTGTRGEETIAIRWVDGKFDSQDYSLWDADKTAGQNGMPKSRLPFDPNEMTDDELARELAGRRVTWWNRIAQNTEVAIIGDKLKIEHTYTGGNETARQIHFVDATPNHGKFRAFNVDALMRVR